MKYCFCNQRKFFEAFKVHLSAPKHHRPVFWNCMDRNIAFSFQTPTHFTLSKCPVYPDFASWLLLPFLQPPLELPEPQTGMNRTNSRWRHRAAKVTQPQALGKQSRLQRAKLGRDPGRNGEKSNNSLAIHLMETYPTNRTFRNENSIFAFVQGHVHSSLQQAAAR